MAASGAWLHHISTKQPDLGLKNLGSQPHYVTEQMLLETSAMQNKLATEFEGHGVNGESVSIGKPNAPTAQYVLFIKDGCPCSVDGQGIFNRFSERYKGKIAFIGVSDATPEKTKQYSADFKVPFPIVSDPKLKIVNGFGAKAALYSALVAKNGHIIKMWPGYSDEMLKEMDVYMSQAAGANFDKPFVAEYAPKRKTTGCEFEQAITQ